MPTEPLTLRLTGRAVARADGLRHALKARTGRVRPELLAAFELKNDERAFVRRLLERHARFWVFRTNQRRFAGDFVVVDMSDSLVEERGAWALDLKLGAPVKVGGGGAGNAFVGLAAAVDEIATETGALAAAHAVERVTGDGATLIAFFDAMTA